MAPSLTSVRWPRYANVAGLLTVGAFVALMAVPERAPSVVGSGLQLAILIGPVVATVTVLAWTGSGTTANKPVAQVVVAFAFGVIASALYVKSLPAAAIPIAGGLVFVISLIGLTLTCFVIRNER